MFCTNCGKNIPDGSQFCPECGATQAMPTAGYAPAAPDAPVTATPAAPLTTKPGLSGKTLAAIACGAVAAVVVLILVCSALFSGGKETPLKNYCKAYGKGSASAFMDLYPEKVLEANYDWDYDDKDDVQDYLDGIHEYCEGAYGENFKVSYEIKEEKELDKSCVKALGEYLEDDYRLDADEVSAAYLMEVKLILEGDDDRESDKDWLVIYKYDGNWYMDENAYYYVDEIYDLVD